MKAEGALDAKGAGEVVWLPMDLSTPTTTKLAAEEFLKRETRLDILGMLFAQSCQPMEVLTKATGHRSFTLRL